MSEIVNMETLSDKEEKQDVEDSDLFLLGNRGTSSYRKVSFRNLFNTISTEIDEDLNTINKNLTDAINEVNDKAESGDSANRTVTFESADAASPSGWTSVDVIESGEQHSSLFHKISAMVKNVRYLFNTIGTNDISKIGDGTVTGAITTLQDNTVDTTADSSSSMYVVGVTSNATSTLRRDTDLTISSGRIQGSYDGDPYWVAENSGSSGAVRIRVKSDWTNDGNGRAISLQIGSGGVNRGIYDDTEGDWMLYRDSDNAIHVGTSTVGSGTKPIYLSSGVPTVSSSTVGSTTQPVYLNSGTITAMSGALSTSYGGTGNTSGRATYSNITTTNPTSATTYYLPFATGISSGTNYALNGNNGIRYNTLEGTTDALGYGRLYLGNSTASGTAANKYGAILLYGTGANYWTLSGNKSTSSNYTLYMPLSGGSLVVATNNTAVGSGTKPVYVNSSGVVTASSSTVGSSSNPVYLNSGTLTATSSYSTGTISFSSSNFTQQSGSSNTYIRYGQVVFFRVCGTYSFSSSGSSYTIATGFPACTLYSEFYCFNGNDGGVRVWLASGGTTLYGSRSSGTTSSSECYIWGTYITSAS